MYNNIMNNIRVILLCILCTNQLKGHNQCDNVIPTKINIDI